MLTSESATEYTAARKQALIEEWFNFFTGRPNDLLSFEEIKQNLRLQDSAYKGLQEIELDKIVGSTGRYRDFTRTFLPKTDESEQRWRRIDAIAHDLEGFPPIEVYKVDDVYFVRDGNHRVSVARTHKAKTIEAYVIEYKTPVPISKDDDLDDILLKTEQAGFFAKTRLDKIRPGHTVVFTEPGRYRLVEEHIAFHKYLKEVGCSCQVSYEEAVTSWYDNVYMPIVERIREEGVLKNFPDRTEADLYAWLLLHRAAFEKETRALGYVPTEDLIERLKRERATNPFARLMGIFRRDLDWHSLPLKVERAKFLEETQLDENRPNHNIKFTESGCYELARRHINEHKYFRETDCSCEIPYQEAAASWYDQVYLPVIELIRERNVLRHFPKNTEGDLYIWLVAHREILEKEKHIIGRILTEKIIEDLEREISSKSFLKQFFGQKLDLQSVLTTD
jgi:hypothetical protein